MTTLTFESPSRRCPYRIYNGLPCTIVRLFAEQMVKRVGRRIPMYAVDIHHPSGQTPHILAFGDELFIEPRDVIQEEDAGEAAPTTADFARVSFPGSVQA